MSEYGLLIDYNYCTGCHSCEVACQFEHGFATDKWGIKLAEIGPWQITEDKWQYDYIPVPTDQCDLCADRTASNRHSNIPTCVKHCQSLCMYYGTIDELAAKAKAMTKTVLWAPK